MAESQPQDSNNGDQNQKKNTIPSADSNKKVSIWRKFLDKVAKPSSSEYDEKIMAEYRKKILQNREVQKEKKEKRRYRRVKLQIREKEKLIESIAGKSFLSRKSQVNMLRGLNRGTEPAIEGQRIRTKSTVSIGSLHDPGERLGSSASIVQIGSNASGAELGHLRYLQGNQIQAPSFFTAFNTNTQLLKKFKERKKKKISQLYTGDVYHHSLTHLWDTMAERSKFYAQLEEEIRKNYPITPEIKAKLDAIKRRKDAATAKKLANANKCLFFKRIGNFIARSFQKTNIGYVFKVTPRYYQMTPVTPVHCRRCRNILEHTLEARWSPVGVTFAVLFPIIGILCCLANREFVCVVCEEIYVYGDYPSRCRPLDKSKVGSDIHVEIKKRSFKRS